MGRDKASLPVGDTTLLGHVLDSLRELSDCLIVAARDEVRAEGALVCSDLFKPRCAIVGLHAVLSASRRPVCYVTACDMPYQSPALVRHLLTELGDHDLAVPEGISGPEPLCAVYRAECLPAVEACIRRGRLKMTDFYGLCRVRRVPVDDHDWLVLGRSPFTNVNTPGEYEDLQARLKDLK
jgi:molybdopterin-guanine dinucleotide biosynthesis protein A